jgi:hypothetical protein
VIDVISRLSNEHHPMRPIHSVAATEGKKADAGTMTTHPDANPTIVTDSADTQTLTPATTTEASDILMCNSEMSEQLSVNLIGWLYRPSGASGGLHWRICVDIICCVNIMGFGDLLDRCELIQ